MAPAEEQNFDHDSHSKTATPRTNKMNNQPTQGGEELLKAVLRKRTNKGNTMGSTASTEKICISTHNLQNLKGEKLLKVLRKGVEKVNIIESEVKSKPIKVSKKMCFCSPTAHEGSFRCRLHRISEAKKPVIEKRSNLSYNSKRIHGMVEFKPQLSRFGRAASAEVSQPSVVNSA